MVIELERVDYLLSKEEALDLMSEENQLTILFGVKAVKEILQLYKGYEYSYITADRFCNNLIQNLRGNVLGYPAPFVGRRKADQETVDDINKYLKQLKLCYHFELVSYGTDAKYLKLLDGYKED